MTLSYIALLSVNYNNVEEGLDVTGSIVPFRRRIKKFRIFKRWYRFFRGKSGDVFAFALSVDNDGAQQYKVLNVEEAEKGKSFDRLTEEQLYELKRAINDVLRES